MAHEGVVVVLGIMQSHAASEEVHTLTNPDPNTSDPSTSSNAAASNPNPNPNPGAAERARRAP